MSTTETAAFKVGDRVQAVQCGEDMKPLDSGKRLPGTIAGEGGAYYHVTYDDRHVYSGQRDPYYKKSLYRAWCWQYWKLEPLADA